MRRAAIALLFLAACDGPTVEPDAGVDAGALDAGPPVRMVEEIPAPGPLVAGVAEVRIPAPLGIGTMGFGAIGEDPNPTPFSEMFPGTRRVHGELTFKAVAISRGPAHEVVFVRMDTVGVFQQLREAVLDELETRLGRSLDDALILAGNHTHSGPGRILMTTGVLTALGDTFFPELYDRMVDALADVVEMAFADAAPAEIATVVASSSEGHSDRRCENDALPQVQEVPDMPLIAVRRGGQIDAIVASYAYHGTVLGIDELTLSGDMGAVVEQRVQRRFDHPVTFLFFNSWGADMAPGNPDVEGEGAPQPDEFDRMERVGDVIADAVMPAVASMTFEPTPDVRTRTYRVELSREAIGYPDDVFRYPNGGAFCGTGLDGNCEDVTPNPRLANTCIRISPVEPLPKQTMISAGRVGALSFVTATGEWGTALANGVLDEVRGAAGGDAMFIGYANDYSGYSLGEDDWYQGGYETSGALWGPRQGDYLAARTVEAFEAFHATLDGPPWHEPARVEPFTGYEGYDLYVAEPPVDVGAITTDVPATASASDVISFTVQGTDPWLGVPRVVLERDGGDGFAPVLHTNGAPVDSAGYEIWLELATTPSYEETLRAESRAFAYTASMPLSRSATWDVAPLSGTYRFAITIPTVDGPVRVETGSFTLD